MNGKSKILIIDDDVELLQSCTKIIKKNGTYDITTLSDSLEAQSEIAKGQYDLFISDLAMPGVGGFDLLDQARAVAPETPFVIFSAYGSAENVVDAMRRGAFDFIEKPFKADRLKVVVEKCLAHRNLHKEKLALERQLQERSRFDNIIGKSPAIQKVFDLISRVAETEANVNISGESGTGKELVARSIHALSFRKTKPFVPVNCGAFPENLFESELFGYEKGAFTGAYRTKPGLLEFANKGTFFLDEVCELSSSLQVKLLRTLQDRNIRRVGGTELMDIDVRIISASNCDMPACVKSGKLREDFYYRLNVISIDLPPLRERRGDIPLLCNHFIQKYAKQTPKEIKGIAGAALNCLENYAWPGNVRELENVLERAIALAAGEWIQAIDLPENVSCKEPDRQAIPLDAPLKEAKREMIDSFEKEYLTRMLGQHGGNVTRAAKASGINRRTFHRLLSRYQILAKSESSDCKDDCPDC
jgi:DNA-binding NtrC family response regulator